MTGPRQFDVVIMPFPFVDRVRERTRPAVIVSSDVAIERTGMAVTAMVTRAAAAPWHGDVEIEDVSEAGLNRPSKLRMTLHTVAVNRLERPIGRLAEVDRQRISEALRSLFAL